MYSGGDYSAAIFDARGRLVSLSTKIPLHIMPILHEVRSGLEKFAGQIAEGDMFITNSPYYGSSHSPDVNVFMPVFDGSDLLFFAATRAHWTDVGGMTPGSISGKAQEIFQEGMIFPLIRLGRKGEIDSAILDLISANVRLPREALGDMRAQIAACHTCRRHLAELIQKYGRSTLVTACDALLAGTEARTRSKISELRDQTVSHFDYSDNDGFSSAPIRLRTTVTVSGDEMTVDYTGSSPQVSGPINATEAVSAGMAYVAIKAFLDPDGPINHGLIEPVTVVCPTGTVVNACPPAATGGYTEIAYNLANLVMAALADIDSSRACAAGSATANHQYIGGFERGSGKRFIYYEYQPGGCGGTAIHDGAGTTRDLASGFTMLQSMEIVESRYPVKIRRHEIAADSAGPGRCRGGLSHVREVQVFADDAVISVIGEHAIIPPFGLVGGGVGTVNQWSILTDQGASPLSSFGGKASGRPVPYGAVIRLITAGGGGFGDPLERDPELVAAEVRTGYVSVGAASSSYGVMLSEQGTVDLAATRDLRSTIRSNRIRLRVEVMERDEFGGGLHVARVNDALAARVGPHAEIIAETHAAPVRVQVTSANNLPETTAVIGPEIAAVMRLRPGDNVELRRLDWANVQEQLG